MQQVRKVEFTVFLLNVLLARQLLLIPLIAKNDLEIYHNKYNAINKSNEKLFDTTATILSLFL